MSLARALPTSFGGGRDALEPGFLDGKVSCHYRLFPLLYAREGDHVLDVLHEIIQPNKLKKHLKNNEAIKRLVYQGRGMKVRALFDRENAHAFASTQESCAS